MRRTCYPDRAEMLRFACKNRNNKNYIESKFKSSNEVDTAAVKSILFKSKMIYAFVANDIVSEI